MAMTPAQIAELKAQVDTLAARLAAWQAAHPYNPDADVPDQAGQQLQVAYNRALNAYERATSQRTTGSYSPSYDGRGRRAPTTPASAGARVTGVTGDGSGNEPVGVGAAQALVNGIQANFGAAVGDRNYNPSFDLNGDGVIDARDYSLALAGQTVPVPRPPTAGRPQGGGNGGTGPSAGPNISLTFPGYYDINPNVEQQYIEWRDQRAAAGEDPYDMNEFRAHLIRLGAPDPGEPGRGITGEGDEDSGPGSEPPPQGTLTPGGPMPPIPSGTPGLDNPPTGLPAPPPEENPPPPPPPPPRLDPNATPLRPFADIFGTGRNDQGWADFLGSPSHQAEMGKYFDFMGDPDQAARNLLMTLGIGANTGNMGFLSQYPAGIARTIDDIMLARGMGSDAVRDLNETRNIVGRGQTSPFANMTAAQEFFRNVVPGAVGTGGPALFQGAGMAGGDSAETAYRFLLNSLAGILNPQMLRSLASQEGSSRLMGQYTNSGGNENPLVWFSRLLGLA